MYLFCDSVSIICRESRSFFSHGAGLLLTYFPYRLPPLRHMSCWKLYLTVVSQEVYFSVTTKSIKHEVWINSSNYYTCAVTGPCLRTLHAADLLMNANLVLFVFEYFCPYATADSTITGMILNKFPSWNQLYQDACQFCFKFPEGLDGLPHKKKHWRSKDIVVEQAQRLTCTLHPVGGTAPWASCWSGWGSLYCQCSQYFASWCPLPYILPVETPNPNSSVLVLLNNILIIM